jgi:hypothetical protein
MSVIPAIQELEIKGLHLEKSQQKIETPPISIKQAVFGGIQLCGRLLGRSTEIQTSPSKKNHKCWVQTNKQKSLPDFLTIYSFCTHTPPCILVCPYPQPQPLLPQLVYFSLVKSL